MKAIVYRKYGQPEDVLEFDATERPVPGEKEIQVRVVATTVNRTDSATIRAIPFFMRVATGLIGPKNQIPGTEFAGTIEETGRSVTLFKKGERVFGFCDLGAGAHAEYLTVAENFAVHVPSGISFEQAAAMSEGFHYALNFVNKVSVTPESKILVNGASGGIGSALVQILKYYGANVTAVCGTKNLELVKSLGADRVIDYQKQDFTRINEKFNCVFDAVGKSSFFKSYRLLAPVGIYISSDLGFMAQNIVVPLLTPLLQFLTGGRKSIFPVPKDIRTSLLLAAKMANEGKFKPVIDREYPFEKIIEAYRYVQTGQKTGNVVIVM